MPGARVHGVEDRYAQVLGQGQAAERPRQLEAAGEPKPRALVRGHPVHRRAVEAHATLLVVQGAADAVHQGRLAGAVRSDQAEPFARLDLEADVLQRGEAAETLAEALDVEERAHRLLRWNRPTMPCGASTTKPTSRRPVISTLTAEDMVTLTYCWSPPTRTAPTTGPIQLDVPPINGMAMALTA